MEGSLVAIRYRRGRLELLEQRRLPLESVFIAVPGPKECFVAIKDMTVRGAPAIAIAAALSLAADLANGGGGAQFGSADAAAAYIAQQLAYLETSRPTAVNLGDAVRKLTALAAAAAAAPGATSVGVTEAVIAACEAMLQDDIDANKAMGRFGAEALLDAAQAAGRAPDGRLRVLTHCNTGSLATAAFGTALGVIRTLHAAGQLEHAYCTETRPYNQGARLTAYELVHDGLPATMVCDSAAAALMAEGRVDAVVVGADRVAANGDTANKVGTYSLAVAAAHHGIPFFIAAPTTTLDAALRDGTLIPIEERSPEEITHFRGERVAAEIEVWNPSFDVTPARLLAGIVTEHGLVPRGAPGSAFRVREMMAGLGLLPGGAGGAADSAGADLATPHGFEALTTETVRDYVAARRQLAKLVGPPAGKAEWAVREVGDGNINFVYVVEGPLGALCVKQALPYVRCVGESWPLSQHRMRIEADALAEQARHCPAHVPALHLFDERMSLIAMQYLAPPHGIVRHGLIEGRVYPLLADHLSTFLAQALFHTSLIALPAAAFRANVARFANDAMCSLTEKVIFTDPYHAEPHNRHTSPQLDAEAAALRSDPEAAAAAAALKLVFAQRPQALLHGDMHTGSLMATDATTYAIDPEFAFYGPIGFDVGKAIANLLLMAFACEGHATAAAPRTEQRAWLLRCALGLWDDFEAKFLALWDAHGAAGAAFPGEIFGPEAPVGPAARKAAQREFMAGVWADAVGFMGAVIIRRLVGIAHVADMDSIADPDARAACERRALAFGRRLLVGGAAQFGTIGQIIASVNLELGAAVKVEEEEEEDSAMDSPKSEEEEEEDVVLSRSVRCDGFECGYSSIDNDYASHTLRMGLGACTRHIDYDAIMAHMAQPAAVDLASMTFVFYNLKTCFPKSDDVKQIGAVTDDGREFDQHLPRPPAAGPGSPTPMSPLTPDPSTSPGQVLAAFLEWVVTAHMEKHGARALLDRIVLVAHNGAVLFHRVLAEACAQHGVKLPCVRVSDTLVMSKALDGPNITCTLPELVKRHAPQIGIVNRDARSDAQALFEVSTAMAPHWHNALWQVSCPYSEYVTRLGHSAARMMQQ